METFFPQGVQITKCPLIVYLRQDKWWNENNAHGFKCHLLINMINIYFFLVSE